MKRILLLHTGGTLGMSGKGPGGLRPGMFFRTLKDRVPELFELAHLELDLFSNLDSSELQPEMWSQLAAHVHRRHRDFDGVVITHGTDTLDYTASALSFMLKGLNKPVVLTGSQRPLGEIRTDARLNLIDAVIAATRGPGEVTVCFDSKLFRGNRTRKVKVSEYDAFDSPNFPALGTLGVDATFSRGLSRRGPLSLKNRIEPRVFLLKVFPGLDPSLPLALLPHIRGLVVEAYGAGNFPVSRQSMRSLLPVFLEARRRQLPVVVVSQALKNGVQLGLYESGAAARKAQAISGGDMTPAAALVKLMHGLAYHSTPSALERYFQASVAGEMTENPGE